MEVELVKKSKEGAADSFGQLYDIYKLEMFRFVLYYLGNKSDAEDAVQDTVLNAFHSIKNLKKNASFKSWLFKILYYSCNRYIGAQVKQCNFVPVEDVIYLSDLKSDINLDKTMLQTALEILSQEEKRIVLLSIISGYSSVAIGKLLNLLPTTVRSKQSRALEKLRNELSEEDGNERRIN